MKASEVLTEIRQSLYVNDYYVSAIKRYAREQIKKDRERVIRDNGWQGTVTGERIRNLPIELD